MFPELQSLLTLMSLIDDRRRHLKAARKASPDAGYSTEAVLATALLAALALTALGIIVAKVTNRANSISVGN